MGTCINELKTLIVITGFQTVLREYNLLYGKLVVHDEDEHSDWFHERSEFCNTDRKDGPLVLCFAFGPVHKLAKKELDRYFPNTALQASSITSISSGHTQFWRPDDVISNGVLGPYGKTPFIPFSKHLAFLSLVLIPRLCGSIKGHLSNTGN